MSEITFSNETVQYISLASKNTGAGIKDCIVEDDRIIFVVEKGDMGIAIGSKGKNLERLRTLFRKNVKFVEFDEDKERFVQNLCKPYKVDSIAIEENDNKSIAKIKVKAREKSKLIGKGGKNINMIRTLARRHHSIRDVQIK